MNTSSVHHHYNPDWLSDDALLAGFIARHNEFAFLREELARAPLTGSVQHHLLVGVRGSGKTTLLKRLAIAIRRDADLRDHLIALSFPEELYQVKNLADFWWSACDALVDEMDLMGRAADADRLLAEIDAAKASAESADPVSAAGLTLLQGTCSRIRRRPVLLVDNLDFVLQRIDKTGRKLNNPHSTAYWALREALSTTESPIVIGGSVRLSEPFTDYDKAFYDFFFPTRLNRLSLEEVRRILERLADANNAPGIRARLQARPSRLEALYELTGGNPRALGLIFELLKQGATGGAMEDFAHLMDITTPYYKARFEDLSEQAQVVMHAMAVRRPGDGGGLRFGHTAAEIGTHAGLATGIVSAQLDILEREGLVEKSTAHGRNQYRIAEQLFRLWLQMRASRRIRQNVIGLAEFLEAMFDLDELRGNLRAGHDASALSDARFAFAMADTEYAAAMRKGLEAHGTDLVLRHIEAEGGDIDDYFGSGDIPEDLEAVVRMREELRRCKGGGLTREEQDSLLGALELSPEQKQAHVNRLCSASVTAKEVDGIRSLLAAERQRLKGRGFDEADLNLLLKLRAAGKLPLPLLTPQDIETACSTTGNAGQSIRAMAWRLVGAGAFVEFPNDETAHEWLEWGTKHARSAASSEWVNVARAMHRSQRLNEARRALDYAASLEASSATWQELARLERQMGDSQGAETSLRAAIQLDPGNGSLWEDLGNLLTRLARFDEAEAAFNKAIDVSSDKTWSLTQLGCLLSREPDRFDDAEMAFRKALEIDSGNSRTWDYLGDLLVGMPGRMEEAEQAYRKSIELDPDRDWSWIGLGHLLAHKLGCVKEAEAAYRRAIEIRPTNGWSWKFLGDLLFRKLDHIDEAEAAYRKAVEIDPTLGWAWDSLGDLLSQKPDRLEDAEAAYRNAIEADPTEQWYWTDLGRFLAYKMDRLDEAETLFRNAIELEPTAGLAWHELGTLLLDKSNRLDEAEQAFQKAIEIEPSKPAFHASLGKVMGILGRHEEELSAYARAAELDERFLPVLRSASADIEARRCIEEIKGMFELGDGRATGDAEIRRSAEPADLAAALVSTEFVEKFLAPLLADRQRAKAVLKVLRDLGYDKHARPLLLAFEAAMDDRADMLDELVPEIQGAAKHMFERLMAPAEVSIPGS